LDDTQGLKFADDYKLVGKANCDTDCQVIQNNLAELKKWSDSWQMQFNSDNCKVLHFGNNNIKFTYKMDGVQLQSSESECDLGVMVSDDLVLQPVCCSI